MHHASIVTIPGDFTVGGDIAQSIARDIGGDLWEMTNQTKCPKDGYVGEVTL